jgi:GNAT superfamily N-acetyltransferase
MSDNKPDISLALLQEDDREQFIKDNQWAFRYGAQIEFGMRDDRTEEGSEVISRSTIERSIDGENAEAYRIVQDGKYVGGVVLSIDKKARKGELELLFVLPDAHSRGIGQAAWKAVENLHPEISVWETITPYFEKRNIHFYVNRLGFHIVEFWNKYQHGPTVSEDIEENWSEDDEMFVFRKVIPSDSIAVGNSCRVIRRVNTNK